MNCKEPTTNEDLIQNLDEALEIFDFSQIIELKLQNKPIKSIQDSNLSQLFSFNIKRLYIINCKLRSIEKGTFNTTLNLNTLDLSKNEIATIEMIHF